MFAVIQLSSVLVRVLTARCQWALRQVVVRAASKPAYRRRGGRVDIYASFLDVGRLIDLSRNEIKRDVRVHVLRRCSIGWSLRLRACAPLVCVTWLRRCGSLRLQAPRGFL